MYKWELSSRIISLQDFEPYEIFTREIQDIVNQTLQKLPEKTSKIFKMSRDENKSHKEIAETFNISTKGVEFHIYKAVSALKKSLKDYLPTSFLFFLSNFIAIHQKTDS